MHHLESDVGLRRMIDLIGCFGKLEAVLTGTIARGGKGVEFVAQRSVERNL